jgi:hypothetical protein
MLFAVTFDVCLCFKDSLLVIEKYKSGFLPPADHPFEDLSTTDGSTSNISQTGLGVRDHEAASGLIFSSTKKQKIVKTISYVQKVPINYYRLQKILISWHIPFQEIGARDAYHIFFNGLKLHQ